LLDVTQAGGVAAQALRSMLDGSRYWTIAVIMWHTPPRTMNHPSPLSIFLQRQLFGIDQRIWEVLGGDQIGKEGLIADVLDDLTASGAVQRIKSEVVQSEALIEN
jgi:hypothetical protein